MGQILNKKYVYVVRENGSRSMKLKCEEKTKTQQNFKDDTDVNKILEKYCRTGELPKFYKKPEFGDFSTSLEFQEAQNILAHATQQFDQLPSKIKKRFSYDPSAFLEFMHDQNNIPEMVKLGLANPSSIKPSEIEETQNELNKKQLNINNNNINEKNINEQNK